MPRESIFMKIVLASQSPYRRALLERLKVSFSTCAPDFKEDSLKDKNLPVEKLCRALALEKAKSVQHMFKQEVIIGSDQIAVFNNEFLIPSRTNENYRQAWLPGRCKQKYGSAQSIAGSHRRKEHPTQYIYPESRVCEEIFSYAGARTRWLLSPTLTKQNKAIDLKI